MLRLQILPWIVYALVYYAGIAAVHQRFGVADVVALRALLGAALCSLLIRILDRHARLESASGWMLATFCTILICLAWIVIGNGVIDVLHPREDAGRPLAEYFSGATVSIYVMLAWLALYFDDRSRTSASIATLASERARTAATEAQMRLLSARLNPHFIFNALNSIRVLVSLDRKAETVRMIDGLSSLMRKSIELEPWRKVTLQQELAMVEDYLQIQQVRFSDRLDYGVDVAGDIGQALVPGQIMQPLVENAVVHAMRDSSAPVRVQVRASSAGGSLLVEVENDNPNGSIAAGGKCEDGFGLSNIRERLSLYYPGRYRFRVGEAGGKVLARIELPFEAHRE